MKDNEEESKLFKNRHIYIRIIFEDIIVLVVYMQMKNQRDNSLDSSNSQFHNEQRSHSAINETVNSQQFNDQR